MVFTMRSELKDLKSKLEQFMRDHIYPNEFEIMEFSENNPNQIHPLIEELKSKAKQQGLWNLFISNEYGSYSLGLSNLDYAYLAEVMGRVPWSSEVFNCNAPDTGNMEVLMKYGSDEQKETWLKPLLNGNIRSAFLMTEPHVASSDARNISTKIVREGNEYVINGRKWWVTNAGHPNCSVFILMGLTDSNAPSFEQQSMILIPKNQKGVEMIRPLTALNSFDYPGGHWEINLKNVRVPASNIILGEGKGFAIAQGRLGPGRIHHCMRLIGMAQRTLEYMIKRVEERTVFSRSLDKYSSVRQTIANAYCSIEQARLLTLKAAHKIDTKGIKEAKDLIAAIKVVAPRMTCNIVDEAIQLFGGMGVSNDIPLALFYTAARALRIADGPDEVHLYQLGRNLIKQGVEDKEGELNYFTKDVN